MVTATKTIKTLHPRNPDTKYMGDEPQWRTQPTDNRASKMGRAFNWYSYFYGKKEAKEMIAVYLDARGRTRDAKKIRATPDSQIRPTTGWVCRMVTMGLELDEHEQIKLDNMIVEALSFKEQAKQEVDEEVEVPRVTIQDRLREKVIECAGELEGLYDDFVKDGAKMSANWKPIATMRGMNIAPQMIHIILDIWKRKLPELEMALAGKDAQLVEGYKHLNKIQLKNCIKFVEQVIADCGNYVQIKKVERKPRKVKPVSPEKVTAKFKFLKEFAELKLKSEPVVKLAEAQEAWLYDTAKRKLIHVVADTHAGSFRVKGSSIIGFDTAQTQQKTLRKPAEQLKEFMSSGKPAARKYFKDIKSTEVKWNGRGNENLIILKAY